MNLLLPWLAAPLDPSPDEARSWLREELARPEYHRTNPLQDFLNWLGGHLDNGARAAAGASPLAKLVALLLFALLAVALLLLLSRVRLARRARRTSAPVLEEEGASAREVRRRAEAALAAGAFEAAVVEGFRALTLRQVERHRLDDAPGQTAHEVAIALDSAYPALAGRIDDAALLFDLVRYGERRATAAQATSVLALDDDLAGARR